MITNQNELTEYTSNNKVYIPTAYVNNNYRYRVGSDTITIITNNNCYNNYNTTYCDCYNYYYKLNVVTERYECSYSTNNNNFLNFNSITTDINYSNKIRNDYLQDKTILFGIFIIALLFFISLKKGYRYL